MLSEPRSRLCGYLRMPIFTPGRLCSANGRCSTGTSINREKSRSSRQRMIVMSHGPTAAASRFLPQARRLSPRCSSPSRPGRSCGRFLGRYAELIDWYAAIRMEELGIPKDQIGSNDHDHDLSGAAFNQYERHGGGISPGRRLNLDSGIFNPDLMKRFGRKADKAWKTARVRTRGDTCIAHEYEEGKGVTHEEAIERAPDTELPISHEAKELARVIRDGNRRG